MKDLEIEWDIKFPPPHKRISETGAKRLSGDLRAIREMKHRGWTIKKDLIDRLIYRFLHYAEKRKSFWMTEEVRVNRVLWWYAYRILFCNDVVSKKLCGLDYYIVIEKNIQDGDKENSFTLLNLDILRNVLGEIKFIQE